MQHFLGLFRTRFGKQRNIPNSNSAANTPDTDSGHNTRPICRPQPQPQPQPQPEPQPEPKCFRIANVPFTWRRDDLLNSLQKIDPSLERKDLHELQLSLYPACFGSTQTALLNLRPCTEYFQQLKSDDFNYVSTSGGTDLVIDSHFYDLTPLNTPGKKVDAELVFHCLALSCIVQFMLMYR